jgi:hypothetical protein
VRDAPDGDLDKSGRTLVLKDVISVRGPVEKINGKYTLLIPLEAGADQLIECSRGISEVQGQYLKIVIPDWLAGMLRIEDGDLVSVNNADGKLHIHPVNPRPVQ